MSLARCQINLIDVHFHLQRSLEIFEKKSASKTLIQKGINNILATFQQC